jgi:hypothetical protein
MNTSACSAMSSCAAQRLGRVTLAARRRHVRPVQPVSQSRGTGRPGRRGTPASSRRTARLRWAGPGAARWSPPPARPVSGGRGPARPHQHGIRRAGPSAGRWPGPPVASGGVELRGALDLALAVPVHRVPESAGAEDHEQVHRPVRRRPSSARPPCRCRCSLPPPPLAGAARPVQVVTGRLSPGRCPAPPPSARDTGRSGRQVWGEPAANAAGPGGLPEQVGLHDHQAVVRRELPGFGRRAPACPAAAGPGTDRPACRLVMGLSAGDRCGDSQ